ncbi:cytochrome b-c1 complex subunit 8-like [Saccoglossus kowalevskii]|uniref:Cytochrome b-c1 complex subunit 8 n=1 Tax=Saccoglossus kowalevskii TaxID=10224 RepID=A0ABM0ME67_SACKO|nr:PREDICTED: cytochrome b-c1 complex subunit 8-like [Saccoglossus kowalevskii]
MGRSFGNLTKVRGIISYSLSPFEQRAFAGFFKDGLPNVWRRFHSRIFRIAPPFIIYYMVYRWGTDANKKSKRKDPSLYVNDV